MSSRSSARATWHSPPSGRPRHPPFAAFRPPRPVGLVPGVDIAMQPCLGGRNEAPQEQRGDDRAGKAAGRDIVDVGYFRVEHLVVRTPQGKPPERIAFVLP